MLLCLLEPFSPQFVPFSAAIARRPVLATLPEPCCWRTKAITCSSPNAMRGESIAIVLATPDYLLSPAARCAAPRLRDCCRNRSTRFAHSRFGNRPFEILMREQIPTKMNFGRADLVAEATTLTFHVPSVVLCESTSNNH